METFSPGNCSIFCCSARETLIKYSFSHYISINTIVTLGLLNIRRRLSLICNTLIMTFFKWSSEGSARRGLRSRDNPPKRRESVC